MASVTSTSLSVASAYAPPQQVESVQVRNAKEKIETLVGTCWETHTFLVTAFTQKGEAYAIGREIASSLDIGHGKLVLFSAGAKDSAMEKTGVATDMNMQALWKEKTQTPCLEIQGRSAFGAAFFTKPFTARVYPLWGVPAGGQSTINGNAVEQWVPWKYSKYPLRKLGCLENFPNELLKLVEGYASEVFPSAQQIRWGNFLLEDHTRGVIRMHRGEERAYGMRSAVLRYYTAFLEGTYDDFSDTLPIVAKPVVDAPGVVEIGYRGMTKRFNLNGPA